MRSSQHKAKQKESTAIHRAQKICAACGRPFSWRKKWERMWDEVRYCSDTCRRKR